MASRRVDLAGQVAIVTGGGRGIGRAIARGLAGAGAAVAVAARSENQLSETVRLIHETGGHALALAADVTDPREVARMVEATERRLGPVDLTRTPNGAHSAAIWSTGSQPPWRRCRRLEAGGDPR